MTRRSVLPSGLVTPSALGRRRFRGSMASLHDPLPTLRHCPRGQRRTARGQCGSLNLHCRGLPPPTPCRSPGALPAALCGDRFCPGARSNGSNFLRHAHQLVPCVTTRIHDGLVVLPNAVAEKVGPEKLPHILDRLEPRSGSRFRRIARKRQQADIVGNAQFRRGVPTGAVQHEHRMRARRNPPAHVGQVCLHRLGVHFRHYDSGANATIRADRAEDVRRSVTPIAWSTRARPPLCPNPREGALLADACFVAEPDLDRRTVSDSTDRLLYQISKAPLKACCSAMSLSGCWGRTDKRRKPSRASSLPMVRSWKLTWNSRSIRSRRSRQRQRTTPSRSRSGPLSIHSATSASWSAERRGSGPGAGRLESPAIPSAL